ncbi:hypothetical protein VNI00_010016 [Paramarasmius palmivorus]|uniref:Peroxidase n=1 Tax=Paramarasmius palmivorus TaxID=297713 RepID=A0AAW0CN97_9AGAR
MPPQAKFTVLGLLVGQAYILVAQAYRWPNPQLEYADKLLFEQNFLTGLVENCAGRHETTVAAQWVRIAYHDMATHNIEDGTGGLDASIAFELDRAENVGIGMPESITDFVGLTSPVAGLADLIAIGTVMAVAGCGGPIVPYRAGRIDATAAGPLGVPEPFQDLASHTESFRRQGFSQSEMIALVACGHTLGGVRRDDFPDIIHDTSANLTTFDRTTGFDSTVVTEYLDGSTNNPLVVGPNATTNSDLRIFLADGNVTMQNLASAENFGKTCSALLGRMINAVPKDVVLSEVVEPIEHKVGDTRLYPGSDGSFVFTTNIRMLISNPARKVTMFWSDRRGTVCGVSGCSVQPESRRTSFLSPLAEMRGLTSGDLYSFRAQVNMTSSIDKFWFEVDEGDGSEAVIVDNGGPGFVIEQDSVLLDMGRTTRSFDPDTAMVYNFVVAVRGDESSQVSVTTYHPGLSSDEFLPTIETIQMVPDDRYPPSAGFTFFTGKGTHRITFVDVHGIVGGQTFTQTFVETDSVPFS